ncbi:metallophosphoesterase [Mycolicibacter heraklionensis]|uniref:Metallophosphoesterase n=1 Tax=Mycolicibacter heraklionensis TaxID=512402 RepID=A0ABR5FGV4_9MYCO|nr:metallophosphoesterase [Mycolicibacter heraklionensis]KLO29701.1 metallophosphoesterase [Mycolicibacter heraklionensis]
MIRVAAVGDIHLGEDSRGTLHWHGLDTRADMLLVAGDLTRHGSAAEGRVVAEELMDCPVPVVCVLGNHDYHQNQQHEITAALRDAGIAVLEGETHTVDVQRQRVGVAGVKGFGGGFAGRCATAFGEPEMKAFVGATQAASDQLRDGLRALRTDYRIALLHYSPVADTLYGEPPEIYPFLGSCLLAEAIDDAGADLAVHGHAHAGIEKGRTAGGVAVRNVARPLIRAPYAVYQVSGNPIAAASAASAANIHAT